jgi:hypothetical protein
MCDVVTLQGTLEQVVEEILTTEPRVETIDLMVPIKTQG